MASMPGSRAFKGVVAILHHMVWCEVWAKMNLCYHRPRVSAVPSKLPSNTKSPSRWPRIPKWAGCVPLDPLSPPRPRPRPRPLPRPRPGAGFVRQPL